MRNVFVIAGHGGSDPGAAYGRYIERDLAIEFRDLVIANLRLYGINAKTDANTNALRQTLQWLIGKFSSRDILIDIHWNAGVPAANGTEIFVPDAASTFERHLAMSLLRVFAEVGFKARGVKPESVSARKSLGWMRPNAENILIEVCFLTNNTDMQVYETNKNILAKKIAETIKQFTTR
jgi:N-acetylmuramoyl-L-alanine amidase